MLYALRKCTAVLRERHGIRKILETVHLYSSLFVLLSERWQKATSCYETYERLKTTVLREVMRSESSPDVVIGDELDRLVLPATKSDNHIHTSSAFGSFVETGESHVQETRQQQCRPRERVELQEFLGHDLIAPDFPLAQAIPHSTTGFCGSFLDENSDLLASFNWTDFESHAFNEQSFMLWNM